MQEVQNVFKQDWIAVDGWNSVEMDDLSDPTGGQKSERSKVEEGVVKRRPPTLIVLAKVMVEDPAHVT